MASTSFQQTLTEPTAPQADTRNLGNTRPLTPTSTAGDIAAGVVGLANLATKAIPIFMKLSDDNTIGEFNQKLNNIINDNNSTPTETRTRVKSLLNSSISDNPHMAQKFNAALAGFGLINPNTTDSEAAASIRKANIIAGAPGADPNATPDELAERGEGVIEKANTMALLDAGIKRQVGLTARSTLAVGKAAYNWTAGLIASTDFAALQSLGASAASGVESPEDAQRVLGHTTQGVNHLLQQMTAKLNGQIITHKLSPDEVKESKALLTSFGANIKSIFSEDGLNLQQYKVMSDLFDRVENIESHQKFAAIRMIKNIFGKDVLNTLAIDATFKQGTMKMLLDKFGSAAKEVFADTPDKLTEVELRLGQARSLLGDKSAWQKLNDEGLRTSAIATFTTEIGRAMKIIPQGKEESATLAAESWSAVHSNLMGVGINRVTKPANMHNIVDTLSTEAYERNLETYSKSAAKSAKIVAQTMGNDTITMGNKALQSAILEIGTDKLPSGATLITYSQGRFHVPASLAEAQKILGKDMEDHQEIAKRYGIQKARVDSANKALDLSVRYKRYSGVMKDMSYDVARDTLVDVIGQSINQNYVQAASLSQAAKAKDGIKIPQTTNKAFQSNIAAFDKKVAKETRELVKGEGVPKLMIRRRKPAAPAEGT